MIALLAVFVASAVAQACAQGVWRPKAPDSPAAIRSLTRSDGQLVGGRISDRMEVWASGDGGELWRRIGTAAGPKAGVVYGDGSFLSDGGREVYCAFREHVGKEWRVVVCRSVDGGRNWAQDSVVARTASGRFVGAPDLWYSRDGDLQCYYDDEETPANAGHPGGQWISMASRPRRAHGKAWRAPMVASRPLDETRLSRDGMASVCNLDGKEMVLLCEGVDSDKPATNCLFAILSHDNGKTWDYASRRKFWAPTKNGVAFNAYCPIAARIGVSVGVVFCTDDDFAAPSIDSAPPDKRNAHVKFMQMLGSVDEWSAPETVNASRDTMYAPSLIETPSHELICTIELLSGGRQAVDYKSVP